MSASDGKISHFRFRGSTKSILSTRTVSRGFLADTSSQAWVTLATNDAYATGALVLAHSLVRAGTTRKKVVMVSGGIKRDLLDALHEVFDDVQDVALLDSLDTANLALLERPELGVTFTKLHCWNLTKYSKCVFLDADTLVSRNMSFSPPLNPRQ